MTLQQIIDCIADYHCPLVCVTGGEPLAQPATPRFLTMLCDAGFSVSLETSGALDMGDVDPRVVKVMDMKTPDSGEERQNRLENLQYLSEQDQIKFVICSREDYVWARRLLDERQLEKRAAVLFSPVMPEMNPTRLAEWILEDGLPVRLQLQLHKLLWGEEPGH